MVRVDMDQDAIADRGLSPEVQRLVVAFKDEDAVERLYANASAIGGHEPSLRDATEAASPEPQNWKRSCSSTLRLPAAPLAPPKGPPPLVLARARDWPKKGEARLPTGTPSLVWLNRL